MKFFICDPHQSGNPDATQYTPIFNGDDGWQLYHGDGYSKATTFNKTYLRQELPPISALALSTCTLDSQLQIIFSFIFKDTALLSICFLSSSSLLFWSRQALFMLLGMGKAFVSTDPAGTELLIPSQKFPHWNN